MIAIDFQGGAHGNYLEFVCNKLAGVETAGLPFNQYGASHSKQYRSTKKFYADHYSFLPRTLNCQKVISIQIDADDLLPLSQISLLRAGDRNLDNDSLEIDTYNKLNNVNYRWVLDILLNSFFANQVATSYQAVKDPNWPDVQTIEDFRQLPEHIQQECLEVHKLELLECSEQSPNCPRHVLREFFEIGFTHPASSGFMTLQKKMQYPDQDVYIFPFASFYNTDLFLHHIKEIANWAGLSYNDYEDIKHLHSEFLARQPYTTSKQKCDALIEQMTQDANVCPKVTLLEEAYINSRLVTLGHERRY